MTGLPRAVNGAEVPGGARLRNGDHVDGGEWWAILDSNQ